MSRGFSKDFGLAGFRYGLMVSCNETLKKDFKKWIKIMKPQPYISNAMKLLLEASNYGQDIIKYNQLCLDSAKKQMIACLKR